MKKVLLILSLLWASSFVKGQVQTITLADGTTVNQNTPLNFSNHENNYRRTQTLYPADMMEALINSKITKVTFYIKKSGSLAEGTYEGPVHVILGSTATASLASEWAAVTSMSPTYSGRLNMANWMSDPYVAFATNFVYTGNNLLIDIQNEGTGGANHNDASYLGIPQTGGSRYLNNGTGSYPTVGAGSPADFLPKVTFEFAPNGTAYTITTNIVGSGTVSPGSSTTPYQYGAGAKPTYTITPGANHSLKSVKLNGTDITGQLINNSYKFAALAADQTLDVTFEPFPQYIINATSGGNGTVSPAGENLCYQYSSKTFTITPNPGYMIDRVSVDEAPVTLTGNTYTFTNIQGPHKIHATFKLDLILKHTVADGTATWSTLPFNFQDNIFFQSQLIYPASLLTQIQGYKITKMTFYRNGAGGVCNSANVVIGTTSAENLSSGFTATTGIEKVYTGAVRVNTNGNEVVIAFQEPYFTYTGGNLLVQMNNQVKTTTFSNNLFIGTATNVTAKSRIEYRDELDGEFYAPETKDFLPKVTFEYESSLPTHVITSSAGTGGKIFPDGAAPVVQGLEPQYIITPNPNYMIDKVTVDGTDVTEDVMISLEGVATYTFAPVEGPHTIIVTFKTAPVYVITATTDGHGTVSPNIPPPHSYGMTVTYNIQPNDGYEIDSVYVDNLYLHNSSRSYTFTYLKRDHTIHVTFRKTYLKKITTSNSCGTTSGTFPIGTAISTGELHIQMLYLSSNLSAIPVGAQIVRIAFQSLSHEKVDFEGNKANVKLVQTDVQNLSYDFAGVPTNTPEYTRDFGIESHIMEWAFNKQGDVPFIYEGKGLLIDMNTTYNNSSLGDLFSASMRWCSMSTGNTIRSRQENSNTGMGLATATLVPVLTIYYISKYTLTATCGAHGSISPSGTFTYDAGHREVFVITPETNYDIATILWNGNDVTNKAVNNGDTYNYTSEPLEDNSTLSVSFKPRAYPITYHNHKNALNPNPAAYTMESPTFFLNPLTKDGYIFDGWYTNTALTIPATAITVGSTGNREFWAKWNDITYNIVYKNEKDVQNLNPVEYTAETPTITLKELTKGGYAFAGWYDNENCNGTAITQIPEGSHGDKTFWAKWTPVTYRISYRNTGNADNHLNPESYTIDETPLSLSNLSRDYYIFGGWYNNDNYTGNPVTTIPKNSYDDKTFWAKWTPVNYTITYENTKDATHANPLSYTIETGSIQFDALSLEGYLFKGWYDNENGTGNPVTKKEEGVTGDIVLWAKWEIITYHIIYNDVNGANNPNRDIYTVETPTFKLEPLTGGTGSFIGWYDNVNYSTPVVQIYSGSTGDIALWAKWNSVGIHVNTMQNIQVYAYMNTVYIVNQDRIPLKSVEITDMTGRVVYRSSSVQSPIHLHVAEGQYLVRLVSQEHVLNTKVFIY